MTWKADVGSIIITSGSAWVFRFISSIGEFNLNNSLQISSAAFHIIDPGSSSVTTATAASSTKAQSSASKTTAPTSSPSSRVSSVTKTSTTSNSAHQNTSGGNSIADPAVAVLTSASSKPTEIATSQTRSSTATQMLPSQATTGTAIPKMTSSPSVDATSATLSRGVIAGISIGAVLVLALCFSCGWYLIRRLRKKRVVAGSNTYSDLLPEYSGTHEGVQIVEKPRKSDPRYLGAPSPDMRQPVELESPNMPSSVYSNPDDSHNISRWDASTTNEHMAGGPAELEAPGEPPRWGSRWQGVLS